MGMKAQEYQVGDSTVVLRIGDILTSRSDVAVSSDDDNFTMADGVSRSLLNAGGTEIKRDAQSQRAKRNLGDMIETTAGTLHFKRIYHVVSRFDGKPKPLESETKGFVQNAVDNCLEVLSRSAYSSIAFPAIGTGYANHQPAEVAATIAAALGKKLQSIKKKLTVELYIFPGRIIGDENYLNFFLVFNNTASWIATPVRDHAVAMIHGIRTDARWHGDVGRVLRAADRTINPVAIGYGFFDVFSFLLPIPGVRKKVIAKVAEELLTLSQDKGTKHISIIAHSFGTYLTAFALLRLPTLKIHRLIICGSVVPLSFKWSKLENCLEVIDPGQHGAKRVINDFGWRDYWPVMAHSVSCGYGSSGRYGFQTTPVEDRGHNKGHSEFFKDDFVNQFWVPALSQGTIVVNPETPPKSLYLLHVLTRIHIKALVAIALIAWIGWRFIH